MAQPHKTLYKLYLTKINTTYVELEIEKLKHFVMVPSKSNIYLYLTNTNQIVIIERK